MKSITRNKFLAHALMILINLYAFVAVAQVPNPYGLEIMDEATYKSFIKTSPDHELIEIKKVIPNITLDIRYATTNNFMHQVMYRQARAFVRKPVVMQLKKVQQELNKRGLGLKIYDGYRPYSVTVAFYKKASDKAFVANPNKGSRHNRGCAVDLSIIDLKTGKDIAMPTPYDSFSPLAGSNYLPLPPKIVKNRTLLIDVMKRHGFTVLDNEWWHFDFDGWKNFDLVDVPFENL